MSSAEGVFHQELVRKLVSEGAVLSSAVERAFREVQLHRFIDNVYRRVEGAIVERRVRQDALDREDIGHVYIGGIVLHRITDGVYRAVLPAHVIGAMLEYLELDRGMKVLVIGEDSGYLGALVSHVVGAQESVVLVPSSERDGLAVQRVLERTGYGGISVAYSDCFLGAEGFAPFDRVLVAVGCGDISDYWMNQLAGNGFALVPLYHGGWFPIVRIEKRGDGSTEGRIVGSAGTVLPEIGGFLAGGMKSAIEVRVRRGATRRRRWEDFRAERLRDFWYYTGLRSREACVLHLLEGRRLVRGFGLFRSVGEWAMIVSRRHEILGESGRARAMEEYWEEWRSIGEPRISSYSMEFVSLEIEKEDSKRWTIERRFFRQEVWL